MHGCRIWYKILPSRYQAVMSVCLFFYSPVEIGWNKDMRISTCGNEDSKINIVPWDEELLKLHFLWIWVLCVPAAPPGTRVFTFLHYLQWHTPPPPYSLQTMPQFPLSCRSHERLGDLQTHAWASWPMPNQQKWYCRASCCSFSFRKSTPFHPLAFSFCQRLQNL